LLPEKRGPRNGHKLTAEVMEFISRVQAADASLSPAQLAQAVQEQFGLSVHPRSIDRQLRREFLGSTHGPTRGLGLALLLDRGMPDWMEACARFVNTAVRTEPQPGRQPTLPASLRTEIVVLLAGMVLEVSGRATSL